MVAHTRANLSLLYALQTPRLSLCWGTGLTLPGVVVSWWPPGTAERAEALKPGSATHWLGPRNSHLAYLRPFLFFFFFLIDLFIYLFLAVLGFHFCARPFSSCGKRGLLFIAVRGPLTIMASLVAEHRL